MQRYSCMCHRPFGGFSAPAEILLRASSCCRTSLRSSAGTCCRPSPTPTSTCLPSAHPGPHPAGSAMLIQGSADSAYLPAACDTCEPATTCTCWYSSIHSIHVCLCSPLLALGQSKCHHMPDDLECDARCLETGLVLVSKCDIKVAHGQALWLSLAPLQMTGGIAGHRGFAELAAILQYFDLGPANGQWDSSERIRFCS